MLRILKKVFFYFLLLNIVAIFCGRFFNPPITITQIVALFEFSKLDRDYISYVDMGDDVKKAVIASEDQKFYLHSGFDFKAIKKAFQHNENNNKIRGGSTISQQTAKNIFLWQRRSWLRKILEAGYTFAIELVWGKKVILERYLNSIEMGRGVFGVEAAAQYYFFKSAKNMSKSEAAWIATVLPNPKKYDPKNPSPYLIKRHNWIMRQMNNVKLEQQ